ncbi:MAG TPA: hypothetical protein VNT53_01080 [Pseudolysinimonas sp.]|nr:hypothetical protein [Pseudolysinimonas sp.]
MSKKPSVEDATGDLRATSTLATDVHFTWPICEVCETPMDFHSIHDEPVWYCSECGTV